jgi:DNA replication and repair protein RecF
MTLIGPHRDDIRIHANGIDLHLYGSRGQNRTAMLAAKLGEVDWLLKRTGDWPVLLLDEVLAELDRDRREDLLSRLETAHQAILTTADLSMFTDTFQKNAIILQISEGRILSSIE